MIIAVDFDGTIVEPKWPEIGKVKFGAGWVIYQARKRGHKLILWTCREGQGLEDAKAYLYGKGIDHWFSEYNNSLPETIAHFGNDSRKIGFDLCIDDKCSYIFWPFQFIRILLAERRYGR